MQKNTRAKKTPGQKNTRAKKHQGQKNTGQKNTGAEKHRSRKAQEQKSTGAKNRSIKNRSKTHGRKRTGITKTDSACFANNQEFGPVAHLAAQPAAPLPSGMMSPTTDLPWINETCAQALQSVKDDLRVLRLEKRRCVSHECAQSMSRDHRQQENVSQKLNPLITSLYTIISDSFAVLNMTENCEHNRCTPVSTRCSHVNSNQSVQHQISTCCANIAFQYAFRGVGERKPTQEGRETPPSRGREPPSPPSPKRRENPTQEVGRNPQPRRGGKPAQEGRANQWNCEFH